MTLPLPGEIVIHDYRPQEKPTVNESLKVFQWNVERNYGKKEAEKKFHLMRECYS